MVTYIILITLSLTGLSNKNNVSAFFYSLGNEVSSYKEISTKKDIPKKVLKSINQWKRDYVYSSFDEPVSKDEKKRFDFNLADVGKPYNWGCVIENGLLFRQLRFAGNFKSKWIISYYHGQGRSHNNKLLIIDLKKPDKISVIYLSEDVKNIDELGPFLINMSKESEENHQRNVYVFNGVPYPNWLNYYRIYF